MDPTKDPSSPQTMATMLRRAPLCRDLDEAQLLAVAGRCEYLTLPGGGTLIRQGDPADCAWLLISGRLRAWATEADGQLRVLNEMGPGEVVGELALLTDEPRSATVGAVRDCELIRVPRVAFMEIVSGEPGALLGVTRVVLSRLFSPARQRARAARLRTLALVPMTRGPALAELVDALGRALSVYGSVLALDHEAARRGSGADPADPPAEWLSDMEDRHARVLMVAEEGASPWTLRCLRQADLVLLVHQPGQDPLPEIEAEIARFAAAALAPRLELVLLGEARAPHDAAALRARYPVSRHHHVRLAAQDEVRRLARLVLGLGHGLVLSGGGARGFAHIGVLRALREAGIPVDAVGGTSIGGMLGALIARGDDPAAIQEIVREAFFTGPSPIDWTVPVVALAAGRRLHDLLRRIFGDANIEDLPLPFFCVSANLTRASVAVHERGPLWRALRASASMPAVFPPMRIGDDLHADGGLVNAMPVDVMRERVGGTGRVLAVDTMFESALDATRFSPTGVFEGGRHLLDGLLGRREGPPPLHILNLLLESYAMGETHYTNQRRLLADVVLRPAVGSIGIVAWEHFAAAVEAGYRAAMARLEATGGQLWG